LTTYELRHIVLRMDMERIIGSLISGFACKLYAAGLGVWIAYEVFHVLADMASKVGAAL
jgi:hypothetical protein